MGTKTDLTPNPEPPLPGPVPPFPEPWPEPPFPEPSLPGPFPKPFPHPFPFPAIKSVKCGCWLIKFTPTGGPLFTRYDGTLRVECNGSGRTASGDLYQRPLFLPPIIRPVPLPGSFIPRPAPAIPLLWPAPNPANGIPILSRGRYRFYLRVTQILEHFTFGNSFTLGFERWRFTKSPGAWNTGGTWTNEGAFTARMTWMPAPAGYPSSGNYLEGDVKDSTNTIVGRLTMGWVSKYLRKATVEIDRVAASEAALNNGAGIDWKAIGNGIDWDITVDESDANLVEPSGEFWSDAECHAEMLARRDASNLDAEWRYYVLCIRRLDSTVRGIMFDAFGSDSNGVPREGCAVSTHWTIPNSAEWGTVQGARFGTATGPYFRTAVHETGHAMGLYHNTADNGFMNTTDVIASNSLTPPSPAFPANIQWSYNSEDAKRLRHMPDIYVRPGGTPFGTTYASTPISPTDLTEEVDGLQLTVTPLLDSVPIGAPVRIDIEMTNVSADAMAAPSSLNMKSGFVKGRVVGPSGEVKTFSPIILCVEESPMTTLAPGNSVSNSITLLRGFDGSLFAQPGAYQIEVEVHWDNGGIEAVATGNASIMVTSATNDAHAQAALKVISTPDALLTLVLGGDHMKDGIDAIQTALDNPVLRPHFAYVEAKRVAEQFGKRKANLKAASDLIEDATVMSPAEVAKAAKLVKKDGAKSVPGKDIARTLKKKAAKLKVKADIKKMVDAL